MARKHISTQIALWFVACRFKILRLVVMHDIRTGEASPYITTPSHLPSPQLRHFRTRKLELCCNHFSVVLGRDRSAPVPLCSACGRPKGTGSSGFFNFFAFACICGEPQAMASDVDLTTRLSTPPCLHTFQGHNESGHRAKTSL